MRGSIVAGPSAKTSSTSTAHVMELNLTADRPYGTRWCGWQRWLLWLTQQESRPSLCTKFSVLCASCIKHAVNNAL